MQSFGIKLVDNRKKLDEMLKKVQFRFPVAELSENTGFSKGSISEILKGKRVPSDRFLKKFSEAYNIEIPNFYLDKEDKANKPEAPYNQFVIQKPIIRKETGVPIYNVPIDASFLDHYQKMEDEYYPVGYINIPRLRNCDFAAIISGNSMYPIMKSGTVAVCRMIKNFDYFDSGEMYFISTTNGFETVKFVERGNNLDELRLIPYNEKIQESIINKGMIIKMCIVEAWLNFR